MQNCDPSGWRSSFHWRIHRAEFTLSSLTLKGPLLREVLTCLPVARRIPPGSSHSGWLLHACGMHLIVHTHSIHPSACTGFHAFILVTYSTNTYWCAWLHTNSNANTHTCTHLHTPACVHLHTPTHILSHILSLSISLSPSLSLSLSLSFSLYLTVHTLTQTICLLALLWEKAIPSDRLPLLTEVAHGKLWCASCFPTQYIVVCFMLSNPVHCGVLHHHAFQPSAIHQGPSVAGCGSPVWTPTLSPAPGSWSSLWTPP